MLGRWLVAGLAIALLIGASPLGAQRQPQQRPLGPQPDVELRVAPFFDGCYTNPDGTITFSFGYSNLNREEIVEIPLGPDNFIEPKEFDGRQPTSFPPVVSDAPDGGRGRHRSPRSRAGRVHRHGPSRFHRRRGVDAAAPRADLQRSRASEEQRVSAAVADGDGIDPAAPAIHAGRSGRPRPDGNRRRSAAGVSRRAALAQRLDRRRQQAREGAHRRSRRRARTPRRR